MGPGLQASSQQPASASYNPFAPGAEPQAGAPAPQQQQPPEDPFGNLFGSRPGGSQYGQVPPLPAWRTGPVILMPHAA